MEYAITKAIALRAPLTLPRCHAILSCSFPGANSTRYPTEFLAKPRFIIPQERQCVKRESERERGRVRKGERKPIYG